MKTFLCLPPGQGIRGIVGGIGGLILLSWGLSAADSHLPYGLCWSAFGTSGVSTGGTFSVSGTAGPAASALVSSANFSVSGSFEAGTIVLPDACYTGINLLDPIQATADFDGDGVPNLMEFALGTDPRSPISGALLPQLSVTQTGGEAYITMQFKRRNNASDLGLHYSPEVSSDGTVWYSDTAHVMERAVVALDSKFDLVTVQDLTPLSAEQRFIRLRVTEN